MMKYLMLLFCLNANASILSLTDSTDTLMDVQLHSSATYKATKMDAQEAQLMSKKIGLVTVKIMVVEKFVRNQFIAVRLNFLRNIDSGVMQSTIDEYLTENLTELERFKYKLDISKVMEDITSEDMIDSDKVITVVGDRMSDEIVYENSNGKVFVNSITNHNFITKIFDIWFK